MEPRCPDCCSPDIQPAREGGAFWRCRNCGARFAPGSALVTLGDAERFGRPPQGEPAFTLDREAAEREPRDPDGEIDALDPYADAGELRGTLLAAVESGIIETAPPGAALRVDLTTGAEPHPVLVVDPGAGPELVGPELALRPEQSEDPVAYTLRWLGRIVADACAVVAGLRVPPPRAGSPIGLGRSPGRRYRAICSALFADGTVGATLAEADALSLTGVLAEIGARAEAAGLDPQADALDLTVSWEDRRGEEG